MIPFGFRRFDAIQAQRGRQRCTFSSRRTFVFGGKQASNALSISNLLYTRMHTRTPASFSPLQFPSATMQYIWHLDNAPQQRCTIYLTNISRPVAVHGIFMKRTWQPVFSAVFMDNTAKCIRCLPSFPQAAILPGPQDLCLLQP